MANGTTTVEFVPARRNVSRSRAASAGRSSQFGDDDDLSPLDLRQHPREEHFGVGRAGGSGMFER